MPRVGEDVMVTPGGPTTDGETHALGYHQGSVLYHLAGTYETLPKTLVEAVQNAVDADAETVFIGIDVPGRTVIIMDDGKGIWVERYKLALRSIGLSIKEDPDALGEFGLGMISPVPKGKVFTVWSRPMGFNEINQWTFEGEVLRAQENVHIPYSSPPQAPSPPKRFIKLINQLQTRWRTVLKLEEVTNDRATSQVDLDDFEAQILTKLGRAMRLKGTVLHVALLNDENVLATREIKPGTVTGEPLPVTEFHEEECGKVIFRLYRAPMDRGRRKGRVEVLKLGAKAAVGWSDFRVQAMGSGWLPDVKDAFDALGSGFFEGSIEIEGVALSPARDKFVMNDQLRASYIAIYRWFIEYGKAYFEEERDARRDQRYVELGERSLERLLSRLINDPLFTAMVQGLIGRLPEQAAQQSEPTPREPSEPGKPRKRRKVIARQRLPRPEPEHGKGAQRPPQEATSFTVSFAYEPNPESPLLFSFDADTGLLTFNILHPVWVMLDETKDGKHLLKHDRQIMKLQEWLAFKVLLLFSQNGAEKFHQLRTMMIDAEVEFYALMFCVE